MQSKRQAIQQLRRRKQSQKDRAIERLLADLEAWDAERMAWLIARGYPYAVARRAAAAALRVIWDEPMTDDERVEYINLCLEHY